MAASIGGVSALLDPVPAHAAKAGKLLGVAPIPVSTADEVMAPTGYTARVLIGRGDPVSDGPVLKQDASNTAAEQAQPWAMHDDGLVYFPISGSARGLIVQSHEYTDDGLLFTGGTNPWTAANTEKSLGAHGVGIVEVTKQRGGRARRNLGSARPLRPAGRRTGRPGTSLTVRRHSRGGTRSPARTSASQGSTPGLELGGIGTLGMYPKIRIR